jgi:hypothetical protein
MSKGPAIYFRQSTKMIFTKTYASIILKISYLQIALLPLVIVLSKFLPLTASDYSFGIFKLFLRCVPFDLHEV